MKGTRRNFLKQLSLSSLAVVPGVQVLADIIDTDNIDVTNKQLAASQLYDCSYRLIMDECLLYLEFYFINVECTSDCPKYLYPKSQTASWIKSYMVVRLPQQHISETFSMDCSDINVAKASISGYSYLAFQIQSTARIKITAEDFMNWNAKHFTLISKGNDDIKPFTLYPLGYGKNKTFDISEYPHNRSDTATDRLKYGNKQADYAPITAIEAPYGLILSPRLPSWEYDYEWIFSSFLNDYKKSKENSQKISHHELWMATLRIKKTKNAPLANTSEDKRENVFPDIESDIVHTGDDQIQLMILGPDHDVPLPGNNSVLPTKQDYEQIKYIGKGYTQTARTNALTFTPLGICTTIHLKNNLLGLPNNNSTLYSWKHCISFGRDQEVEVATLYIEKDFGIKFLYIQSVKRLTIEGTSRLLLQEYVMPLENEKDFSSYVVSSRSEKDNEKDQIDVEPLKYNTPFKRVVLTDMNARKVNFTNKDMYVDNTKNDKNDDNKYAFWASNGAELVQFPFVAYDWQDKPILFSKNIFLLSEAINKLSPESMKYVMNEISIKSEEIILGEINDMQKKLEKLNQEIEEKIRQICNDFKSDIEDLVIEAWRKFSTLKEDGTKSIQDFLSMIPQHNDLRNRLFIEVKDIINEYCKVIYEIKNKTGSLKSRVDIFGQRIGYCVNQIEEEMNLLKESLKHKYKGDISRIEEELDKYRQIFADDINGKLTIHRTNYIILEGKIRKAVLEGVEKLDIFNEYPSYPQLRTAEVILTNISEITRTDIAVKIRYAEDYINNQIDNYVLNVDKNLARCVLEIQQDSKVILKEAFRSIQAEIGGLISPEIAADYVTLVKNKVQDVREVVDGLVDLSDELVDEIKQLDNQLQDVVKFINQDLNNIVSNYMDSIKSSVTPEIIKLKREYSSLNHTLSTISNDAKDAFNRLKDDVISNGEVLKRDFEISTVNYFKGLEAKILGSIKIKDILGENVKLPNILKGEDTITYSFVSTSFKELRTGFFAFKVSADTKLISTVNMPIRNAQNFRSSTVLNNFAVSVLDDRLSVNFNKLELFSTPSTRNRVNVEIGNIKLGKELEFLAALTKGIQLPGTGVFIKLTPAEIAVSYSQAIPGITAGSFTFDNLSIGAGISIPMPKGGSSFIEPIKLLFNVNSPASPFYVAVTIFGGMGWFMIEATPRYISKIDAFISFGGILRLNFGVASGTAFLQGGIRYIYSRDALGRTSFVLEAIITCGANVTVLRIISVSIVYTLKLSYFSDANGTYLEGSASVSVTVRLAFLRRSFNLTFKQKILGSKPNSSSENVVSSPQEIAQKRAKARNQLNHILDSY